MGGSCKAGSVLGSGLYTLLEDSLLRKVKLPSTAFAYDFKFVADVVQHDCATVRAEVNKVVEWSIERHIPLFITNCMHGECSQTSNTYYINDILIPSVDSYFDLGSLCSSDNKIFILTW